MFNVYLETQFLGYTKSSLYLRHIGRLSVRPYINWSKRQNLVLTEWIFLKFHFGNSIKTSENPSV